MIQLPPETLRIIDANLNRIGEGLRVLEEFARMILDDKDLTQMLKTLRHRAVNLPEDFIVLLVGARDADGDIGREMNVPGEDGRRTITETVTANAKRVQESLRVMEEMAKTTAGQLDPEIYRQTRFGLYTVEKDLILKLNERNNAN